MSEAPLPVQWQAASATFEIGIPLSLLPPKLFLEPGQAGPASARGKIEYNTSPRNLQHAQTLELA